ncbi:MAG TPA: transglycosylase SLT domain-containing protein [bacterium]|nr:transglycosylase SLT domain-containing protein [bacterium]
MKGRAIAATVLVLGMGAGLHFTFAGLGRELPELFPRLAHETRVAPPIPVVAEDPEPLGEASELEPPAAAIPLKLSGEDLAEIENLQAGRKLVSPSRLPDFSHGAHAVSAKFDVPGSIEPIVNFWKKVYAVYDSNQVVLHDMDHLEIEYGVLDFSDLDRRDLPDSEKKAAREAEIGAAAARIKAALAELDEWEGLHPLSEEALRISRLFQHVHDADKYKKAQEGLRTQTGIKDRFAEAVRRSGKYMPLFEEVFAYYGVPKEITRLVFVESMFRERALSKVQAAGLWQFMADSARRYMTVDKDLDERYDPIVATHGAAKLLLRNYDLLGTWPLAINAYNSGPGNLQKAVQKLGTRDIGRIIREFRGGSYAFASRNFYPSFLAALHVYENHEKYFGRILKEAPWKFDPVQLPATMSFPEIAFLSDTPLESLKELNPAYSETVLSGRFSLPAGSQIRLPAGRQPTFASRFVQHSAGQVASILSPPAFHVVTPGESYTDIAARYGIPFQDLRRWNSETDTPGDPSAGKVLLVPSSSSLVRD